MKRRGIALIDAMIAGMLLATLLFSTTYVIMQANTAARNATRSQLAAQRFDNAIDTLRRDIWNARDLSISENGNLTFVTPGQIISWSYLDGEVYRAEAGKPAHRWKEMPPIKFKIQGSSLHVTIDGSRENFSLLLESQLAERGK